MNFATDREYSQFLFRLAADQRIRNRINISPWDGRFLHSFVISSRPSLWFTDPRRASADRMWREYGALLGFPHPLDTVHEAPRIPEADPAGCEYLVRGDDGRQRHCNEPAAWQGERRGARPGLRYCEAHKIAVERAFQHKTIINPWSPHS
jgi:hypothetical protein